MNLTQKLEEAKRFGIAPAIKGVIHSGINKLFFFKALQGMIVSLDTLDQNYLEVPQNYQYAFLSDEQILQYSQDESNQMEDGFVRNALAKGDKCFGILDGPNLVSYGWYSSVETNINDDLLLYFDSAWIYMYKGYTKKSHRGQRLHEYGMAMALKAFSKMGKKGLISYVEAHNFMCLRSTARMGYLNFGKVFIAQIFKKFWIRTEKKCVAYGFGVKEIKRDGIVNSPEDSTLAPRNLS